MKKFILSLKKRLGMEEKKRLESLEDDYTQEEGSFTSSEDLYSIDNNVRPTYIFWLHLVLFVIFIILFSRLWIVQIIKGEENLSLAEGNRIRTRNTLASRGLIYDRNKVVLAKNIPNFSLIVYPADLSKEENERFDLYKKIAEIADIPFSEVEEKVEQNKDYYLESIVVKENIEREAALILEEKTSDLKGVAIEKRSTRGYTSIASMSHILGYIGEISQEEFESSHGYLLTDKIGKMGVERAYEKELKGTHGKEQIEVDSFGHLQKILAQKDPEPGSSLVLSIDLGLQDYSANILQTTLNSLNLKKGVAIVSNPKDGSILALVSLPVYDNNIFTTGQAKELYPQLLADESKPLFNRAISGVYPSGSVVKPVVAAAALQESVVGVNDWIIDKGEITVPNQYDPNIIYRYVDWMAHGGVNIIKAIAESCNVFFYHIGGGYDHIKGLGLEKMIKYFKLFGLGSELGIDLSGEATGLVPDADWKLKNKGETWVLGDTYHLSIGQGDLGVTPLQVNAYTSAIANGGKLYKPHLAKEFIAHTGEVRPYKPEIKNQGFIGEYNLNIVKQGMRACVTSGSCDKISILPVTSAGKTGTAQSGIAGEGDHAWFTAFAPYEDPQVVITVLVENGGEGSKVAAPVARDILYYYFTH